MSALAERQLNALEAAEHSLDPDDQRWAARRRKTLEAVADWLEFEQKVEKLVKHAAPIHPGTGTDQSVHGRGRGVAIQYITSSHDFEIRAEERDPNLVENEQLENPDKYISPILHNHQLGPMSDDLERLLIRGSSVRERYLEALGDSQDHMDALEMELEELEASRSELLQSLNPLTSRVQNTIKEIARFEASRYKGLSMEENILQYLSDADNGATISERLAAFRESLTSGELKSVEVELTQAQVYNLEELWDREDMIAIDGQYEIEQLMTRTGNPKGGILRLYTNQAKETFIQRAKWGREDAGYAYEYNPGRERSWINLMNKLEAAPSVLSGPIGLEPQDTHWLVALHDGSQNLWGMTIQDYRDLGGYGDWHEIIYMGNEIQAAKFLGESNSPPAGDSRDWVFRDGEWQTDIDQAWQGIPRTKIVSSEDMVDRLLLDADYVHTAWVDVEKQHSQVAKKLKEVRGQHRSLHGGFVRDFLESEGIKTGTSLNVKSRRGKAKNLSEDAQFLPAAWVGGLNEFYGDRGLGVKAKKWGGTFLDSGEIETDGTFDTNIHEIGHGIEKLGEVKRYVREFSNYRTSNGTIRGKTIGSNIWSTVTIFPDSYTDSYSGKVYGGGHWELLSNGLGNLYASPSRTHRQMPDKEHLDFLFGLMLETAS